MRSFYFSGAYVGGLPLNRADVSIPNSAMRRIPRIRVTWVISDIGGYFPGRDADLNGGFVSELGERCDVDVVRK